MKKQSGHRHSSVGSARRSFVAVAVTFAALLGGVLTVTASAASPAAQPAFVTGFLDATANHNHVIERMHAPDAPAKPDGFYSHSSGHYASQRIQVSPWRREQKTRSKLWFLAHATDGYWRENYGTLCFRKTVATSPPNIGQARGKIKSTVTDAITFDGDVGGDASLWWQDAKFTQHNSTAIKWTWKTTNYGPVGSGEITLNKDGSVHTVKLWNASHKLNWTASFSYPKQLKFHAVPTSICKAP